MNPYKVLGITDKATQGEIKNSYYKLAKKYHPDTNQGNEEASERFKEVNKAYKMINTEEKKFNYDHYGTSDMSGDIDIKEMERIFNEARDIFEKRIMPEEFTGKMYNLDDI